MEEIQHLRAEIDALRKSTSWRVTAPLRALGRALRPGQQIAPPATTTAEHSPDHRCRLCGGETAQIFRKAVLGRLDIGYHRCSSCGSIQTDQPYWLEEAYSIPGVHIDVGIAQRTIKTVLALSAFLRHIEFPKTAVAVDFGAASGLLARFMRDAGYDFRAQDRYDNPFFVNYFLADDLKALRPSLLTAFEVFEHLPDPKSALTELFELGCELIVFSTWFCDGHAEEWRYFAPECGQHVFFYSDRALRQFAAGFGYELKICGPLQVLVKADSPMCEAVDSFPAIAENAIRNEGAAFVSSALEDNPNIDRDYQVAEKLLNSELERRKN